MSSAGYRFEELMGSMKLLLLPTEVFSAICGINMGVKFTGVLLIDDATFCCILDNLRMFYHSYFFTCTLHASVFIKPI